MHQRPEGGILEQNTSHRLAGINSRTATYQSNHVVGTTYQCNFTRTDAKSYQTVPVADNMCADPMDDDEILAVGALLSCDNFNVYLLNYLPRIS
jgi:hypothetical protein